jgi:CubicO group peptidase (beta-lactamase class C family)
MTNLLIAILFLAQSSATAELDRAVNLGIDSGAFPGATVIVGTSETVLLAKGYGHFTWSADSPIPDPDSTLYDLASLTKVVATTASVMRLVEMARLDLDAPVQEYLPGFVGEGKASVTVRNLLEHRSGMRAFLPLNERASTYEEARALVEQERLRWEPGSRVEYSDLNAMLLGWVVESASDDSLDRFAASQVFAPLGMTQTMYRPPRNLRSRMAPVGLWRGHVIAGELHDQNAVRLGGVSGHAGLYSTGADLVRYAQLYLNVGRDGSGRQFFDTTTVRTFTRRRQGNRALGWEMRDTTDTANTGSQLSSSSFGHTGYTGTSLWIDPRRGLFVIILTNRVFAPRTGRSISTLKEVRGRVADAAVALQLERCTSVTERGRMYWRC